MRKMNKWIRKYRECKKCPHFERKYKWCDLYSLYRKNINWECYYINEDDDDE